MNNSTVKLTMPDPDDESGKRRIADPVATAQANEKIGELREKFSNWIWTSPERITRLASVYNEEFNSTVTPEFDQVPLTFEGMALERGDQPFNLRSHQEQAVWRGIVSGKGIYAHEVGTGKTLTMAGLAMESRRLGLASKPLLMAHNANSQAVVHEIQEAYPNANILYVDNLDAKRKEATLQSIATEEWDLIVVPHSMTDNFMLRPETVEQLLKPEMDALESAAREAYEESDASDFAKGSMPDNLDDIDEKELGKMLKEPTAKELVKERLKLRARIDAAAQAMEKGTGVTFEDMGIDMVMVDEAHIYKKLPITTKQNIKGLNKRASKKGTMLMMLADYVRTNNNGRGVHLFTGTPITNTINEVFNMMRFVMAEEMDASGVRDWDGWFGNFATQETLTELSSGGTWENFDRLSSFVNLPELRQMVGQYMDIVFAEDMPEFIPRDNRDGRSESPIGRPYKQINNVTIPMIEAQKGLSEDLKRRYTEFKEATGKEKRRMMASGGEHNPLVIEQDGVKLAMDPRLTGYGLKVGPDGKNLITDTRSLDPKDPNLKINRMLHNAMAHYHEHPKSAQMIFMQIGHKDTTSRVVGKTDDGKDIKETVRVFNLAKEIKRRLMEEGVPESEIALFSTMSKSKRTQTAKDMKAGKVRFAIGSTETMGTGVNAQDELIAMHHLDAPWMPGDLEQRNGRGWRQGNKWNTVQEYRYLTEGPQDGRRWQVLLTKHRFIDKFMKADGSERTIEMDDVDMSDNGAGNDMEQTFAAAAGDPRIMMRIRLEDQVKKLERARDNHARTITETVSRANQKLEYIKERQDRVAGMQADYEVWASNRTDTPSVTLRENVVSGKDKINDELKGMGERYQNTIGSEIQIGEYRGIPLFMNNGLLYVGESRIQVGWSLSSLQGNMANIPGRISKINQSIEKDQRFIEMAHKGVGEEFPKQKQLESKQAKLDALWEEMEANPEASPAWFRAGAPINTSVYYQGVEYEVAGHRGDSEILYSNGEKFIPIPAKDITDKEGTPLFPQLQDEAKDEDIPPPPGESALLSGSNSGGRRRRIGPAKGVLQPIRQADIVSVWDRIFWPKGSRKTIKQGGFRESAGKGRVREGIHKTLQDVVRLREGKAYDIIVASHEIGHHIDKQMNLRQRLRDLKKSDSSLYYKVRAQLQAMDYDPSAGRIYEGIAEAFREILTGTAVNASLGPDAVKWVRDTVSADPVFGPAMKEAIKQADSWFDQGPLQRARSVFGGAPRDLNYREGVKANLMKKYDDVYAAVIDDAHLIKRFSEYVKEQGGEGETYDLFMAYRGTTGSRAAEAIEKGIASLNSSDVLGPSLSDALEHLESEQDYRDAQTYAVAKHGLSLPADYEFGMHRDDAQEFVDWVESDPAKLQKYRRFHRGITDYNNSLVEFALDSGRITEEDANRMLRAHGDTYVPLLREQENQKGGKNPRRGSLIELPKQFQRRARRGSGRPVKDLVESSIQRTLMVIDGAMKQQLQESIVLNADPQLGGAENLGGWVDRIDPKQTKFSGYIDEILDQLVEEGFVTREDADIARMARDLRNGIPVPLESVQNLMDRYEIDKDTDEASAAEEINKRLIAEPDVGALVDFWRPDFRRPNGKYVIKVVIDGEPLLYEIDAQLYEHLSVAPPQITNPVLKFIAAGNRTFKIGATGINTAFGLMNLVADAQTYLVNSKRATFTERITKAMEWAGRYAGSVLNLAPNEMVDLYRQAGGDMFGAIGSDTNRIANTRRKMMQLGARKRIEERPSDALRILGDAVSGFFDKVRTAVAITDVGPRIAEMEHVLNENGYENRGGRVYNTNTGNFEHPPRQVMIEAMQAAGDVTYNYRRSGSLTRHFELFVPFTNAAVQSIDKTLRVYKAVAKNPTDLVSKNQLLAMGVLTATYVVTKAMLASDDDELPDWLKHGYLTAQTGDDADSPILRMRMSREHSWLANMILGGIDDITDGDGGLADAIKYEATDKLPLARGIDGAGSAGSAFGLLTNYDSFRGREIEPSYLNDRRKTDRYMENTLGTSKLIAKGLNALLPRSMEVSPLQWEYVASGLTGGAYWRWLNTGERIFSEGPVGFDARDIPVFRGLVYNSTPQQSTFDFYERLEQVREDAGSGIDGAAEKLLTLRQYETQMKLLRDLSSDEYDPRPNIVALAREALGRGQHSRYPHPLYTDVPPEARDELLDHAMKQAKKAATGASRLRLRRGETQAELQARKEAERESAIRWLTEHSDSPIVREAIATVPGTFEVMQ